MKATHGDFGLTMAGESREAVAEDVVVCDGGGAVDLDAMCLVLVNAVALQLHLSKTSRYSKQHGCFSMYYNGVKVYII